MRIVVKLGTSVVADDAGTPREDVLGALCDELAALRGEGHDVVVVSSGAIANGMRLLGLPARPTAIQELQACSAIGQGGLFGVWSGLLARAGLRGAQVLLTLPDLSLRPSYVNARRTLEALLGWGVVPVVNENDTTTTEDVSFGDNDLLAAQVSVMLGASLLVLLTNRDGIFTADPVVDPTARLVETVMAPGELDEVEVSRTISTLGRGGMRSKVIAGEMAAAAGITCVVGSGLRGGVVTAAAHGEPVGTRFAPQPSRVSSFKLWLRWAKPAAGEVVVDAGAARALRDGGTSLLPVGVVDVRGAFEAGDAVAVVATGGEAVGKGLAALSAAELRRVRGLKSAELRGVLPGAPEEAVHRDQFVLV